MVSCGKFNSYFFYKLEFQEIPDKITLPGILIGLIAATAYPALLKETTNFSSFLNSFLGILAGGGSLYLLGFLGEVIFKKQAMGGGDIKLLAMVGAFIGWKLTILAFFLAPFFGVIIGIIAKVKHGKEVNPYGPYLSLGTLLSIFYGEEIIKRIFLI